MSYRAAVITVSDRAFAGVYEDKSGPALCAMLREAGYEIAHTAIVPDEQERISDAIIRCKYSLIQGNEEQKFHFVLYINKEETYAVN